MPFIFMRYNDYAHLLGDLKCQTISVIEYEELSVDIFCRQSYCMRVVGSYFLLKND